MGALARRVPIASGRVAAALCQVGFEDARARLFEGGAGEKCLSLFCPLCMSGERPPGCRPQAFSLRLDCELLLNGATSEEGLSDGEEIGALDTHLALHRGAGWVESLNAPCNLLFAVRAREEFPTSAPLSARGPRSVALSRHPLRQRDEERLLAPRYVLEESAEDLCDVRTFTLRVG